MSRRRTNRNPRGAYFSATEKKRKKNWKLEGKRLFLDTFEKERVVNLFGREDDQNRDENFASKKLEIKVLSSKGIPVAVEKSL